jgi:hypothetical protein
VAYTLDDENEGQALPANYWQGKTIADLENACFKPEDVMRAFPKTKGE